MHASETNIKAAMFLHLGKMKNTKLDIFHEGIQSHKTFVPITVVFKEVTTAKWLTQVQLESAH